MHTCKGLINVTDIPIRQELVARPTKGALICDKFNKFWALP